MRKGIIVVLSFGLATAAWGQSQTPAQTTFDFTKSLLASSGKPQKNGADRTEADPSCEHCRDAGIGDAVAACLDNDLKAADPHKKPYEWALANRILGNAAASLDAHDIALIEECAINNNMTPIDVGQIFHLLEPNKYPEK